MAQAIGPALPLLLSLALGFLIGIERGWAQRGEARGERIAGVRTFAFLGLTGGLAGTAGALLTPWLATALIAIAGVILLIGYRAALQRGEQLSATTAIVGLVTLGIGIAAGAVALGIQGFKQYEEASRLSAASAGADSTPA